MQPGGYGIIGAMTGADTGAIEATRRDDSQARAVVHAVLGGDRDAFRILVERESRSVVRVCYRILGDVHEAEDAAQEAFVTAYRSLSTWRGEGPFGGWLATIATRIAIRRAGKRRPVVWIDTSPQPGADEGPGSTDALLSRALSGSPAMLAGDPSARAIEAERGAAVRRAVSRLDEPYREVVALRFFGDLSLNEIAAESGRPLGTVKTHLHRGLQRLRAILDADGVDA
jgi:RNA polymerase sigma-70 factor (ECF subfamily)